jgi:hypothetical protein
VAIQIIVAEAGSGEVGGAAATSGRSEPCFACRTSRFDFFETPIFLPNKISCKDNNRPPSVSAFLEPPTSVKVSDLNRRNVLLPDINQRLREAFDRLRRTIATGYSSE